MALTGRQRMQVLPRDLQVGDLMQRLRNDLSIGYAAVTGVWKVRAGGSTRYRVDLDDGTAMHLAPGRAVDNAGMDDGGVA